MQRGTRRTSSLFSNHFLLGLFNCCLPGFCNSKAKLRTEMAEPVVIPARSKHTATVSIQRFYLYVIRFYDISESVYMESADRSF